MTPDEQFAANCALLAQRPGMEQMPAQLQAFPITNIQLVPGTQGQLYGQVWDVPSQTWTALCSPHDPIAEAEKDCDTLYTRDAKVFTLLGMGLGYFATAFAKRLEPWQRLIVWDCDANMFKAMMYAVDIAPLFSAKRTDVYIGPEVLGQVEEWWLKMDATEKLHIVPPFRASYTGVYQKESYDALMQKTVDMMRFHAVGLSTWKIFGSCIGDNDLLNMPDYFLNPGYEHLHDLWKDRPAVCLAAGPSLQKNLAHLLDAGVREKVALISAGTVYALVHGLGLAPDIVTTIDFQRLNWTDQFAHIPLDPACPLVYLHSTYPQTVRRWPGPKFVAENASDTVGWIRKYSEGKKSAAQVQTVAHLNLMVALELGANPIILLGQDLAMPRDAHHAAGARAQDLAPDEAPAEAFVEVPDYQGKMVHTRHSFLSMKTVFERMIAEHPDRTFFNCSEGGLALVGAQHLPLCEVLGRVAEHRTYPGALRRTLADVCAAYKPQVKDTFQEDFRQLCCWVEDVREFAEDLPQMATVAETAESRALPPDMWDAAMASDCLSVAETVEDCATTYWNMVLLQERIIQERQPALALFAIRRFDFLELMSQIPPQDADVATPLLRAKYNGARLLRVAAMIREELPHVRQILGEVQRRLEWLEEKPLCPTSVTVQRLYSRQRYDLALEVLRETGVQEWELETPQDAFEYGQHLYAHYLYHTQQYEAACAVMHAWHLAPVKMQLMQRYLVQWRNDVRHALPAYFRSTENQQTPLLVPEAGIEWHG